MERDPAAVLQAAIRGVVDRLPDAIKDEKEATVEFHSARYFTGAKRGYFFGTGESGTGYYLDASAQPSLDEEGRAVQAVDPEELLREAEEQANGTEVQLLDAKSLRRYAIAFDRKYKENQEMRVKYADQPEKFMESELDLDEEVQRLLAVAGTPELYPDFVKTGVVENLMNLLSHENTDIAADVLDLFQQLTDADVIEDSEEEAKELVAEMINHNGLELLVHRLLSLVENSDEERKAVFNTLSTFENMVEVNPEVAEWVLERTKLLKWLLGRLRPREFDSNKQYTSELLAILIQNSVKNQQRLADMNGIDSLLQAIAPYKSRNPGSRDEEEFLENLFNCLCACLMSSETRTLFQQAEGTELMLLILKQKRIARAGALKALDFATTKSPGNCERFVDQLGLKTIFAIFMGKTKLKRRKGANADEMEEEERALSVIANLFQGLARGSRRDRLAAKFVENEFEKCDRLVELFDVYHKRIQIAEAEAHSEDEMGEEDQLLARLEQGIYSLQQCALIIGHLWFVGDTGVRKRILQLLHQRGHSLTDVRNALQQFMDSIGDSETGDIKETEKERSRVRRMLQALGQEAAVPAAEAKPPRGTAQQDGNAAQPNTATPGAATGVAEVKAEEDVKAEPVERNDAAMADDASGSSDDDEAAAPSSQHAHGSRQNGSGRRHEDRHDSDDEHRRKHKRRGSEKERRHSERNDDEHRHRGDRKESKSDKRHRDHDRDERRDRKRDRK